MTSPLLFVPFTYLTIISLSNFYSLNLCLATILLSINIPVTPLFKSTFTVIPSYVSNFFTSILIHTSLSILKVLLTFLWLLSSLAALSNSLGHVPLCYAFFSMGHTVMLQANFPWKITFDILYNNRFLIEIHSRTISIILKI